MKMITVLGFSLFLFVAGCWIGNLYKLTQCDFEKPYKCEIIHAVGIIPVASIVTVWFEDK